MREVYGGRGTPGGAAAATRSAASQDESPQRRRRKIAAHAERFGNAADAPLTPSASETVQLQGGASDRPRRSSATSQDESRSDNEADAAFPKRDLER